MLNSYKVQLDGTLFTHVSSKWLFLDFCQYAWYWNFMKVVGLTKISSVGCMDISTRDKHNVNDNAPAQTHRYYCWWRVIIRKHGACDLDRAIYLQLPTHQGRILWNKRLQFKFYYLYHLVSIHVVSQGIVLVSCLALW